MKTIFYQGQAFVLEAVTEVTQLLGHWEFFLEGLVELNELLRERRKITPDELLQTLLTCISMGGEDALIAVVKSKNNKPLGWGVVYNNSVKHRPKSCLVFGVYSNKKSAYAIRAALTYLEEWAKLRQFKEIQAFCTSMNGSRFRVFEKIWKFRRSMVLFTKEI